MYAYMIHTHTQTHTNTHTHTHTHSHTRLLCMNYITLYKYTLDLINNMLYIVT